MRLVQEKNLCAISIRQTVVSLGRTLFFAGDADHMADAGDGLPLKAGGGRQQRPGGGEDDALPPPGPQAGEEVAVEHRGGAAAAGGSGVHVLGLAVVEQQAAVLKILAQVHAVPGEEVPDDGVAQLPQVAGDHQVVVPGLRLRVPEEGGQGVVGGGGRSLNRPVIKINTPVGFSHVPLSGQGDADIHPDT